MTVRFFMLQTHYRSTLDFSNEALQASEKGLKRLWDAYETLQKIVYTPGETDVELEEKVLKYVNGFEESMNDDFNTAKVLANMFELVPVINSFKDGLISVGAITQGTFEFLNKQMSIYLKDVFGLKADTEMNNGKLSNVLDLLIEMRKEAKTKKDFATSDKIRNQLKEIGILLKDEKNGEMSWGIE
jgi:cysteinyl-tRNA synthetase